MGMIEYATKAKPGHQGTSPRPPARGDRYSFTLVEARSDLTRTQPARTRGGELVHLKFTDEAARMWKRLKAVGKTPKVASYRANYAPTRTAANPKGITEITVLAVSAT